MIPPHWIPYALIGIYILCALNLAVLDDWKRAFYWLCAAGITFAVT